MGAHDVKKIDADSRAKFIRHLLDDIKALEYMLENGIIENDIVRIGAEQELCLLNENWRPANNATALLHTINDSHFTNEMARFNLEINCDPIKLSANCFEILENQLTKLLQKAANAAKKHDTKILLTGILPSIGLNELSLEYMTPSIRYQLLNEAIKNIRKKDFELHIRGLDELSLHHDSILFEACNTSFQLHLQIAPDDFVASYNWAQAISGPVLGIAVNSPILLGRELWSETRIALFQQSVDTRSTTHSLRDKEARVTFGSNWASGTIADIYKDDLARFQVMLNADIEKNSLEELEKGNIPKLKALNLHNGTIYRWNRACYGAAGDKPHIRIENRYIPAGPTVLDEVANFAFWVGLMSARPSECDDMVKVMDFRDAKDNFIKAARYGSDSMMNWMGKSIPICELITQELLPLAHKGLQFMGVDQKDIERLLGIIESRARKGITGAKWNISNYRNLKKGMKQDDALIALTKGIYKNQKLQLPISKWPKLKAESDLKQHSKLAEHLMSTQLFTVNENDLADMATSIMQWKNIHHVPVINDDQELCGLLTWSHMKAYLKNEAETSQTKVSEIMIKNVLTVLRHTTMKEVAKIMKVNEIGCVPVLQNKILVGIITHNDGV